MGPTFQAAARGGAAKAGPSAAAGTVACELHPGKDKLGIAGRLPVGFKVIAELHEFPILLLQSGGSGQEESQDCKRQCRQETQFPGNFPNHEERSTLVTPEWD